LGRKEKVYSHKLQRWKFIFIITEKLFYNRFIIFYKVVIKRGSKKHKKNNSKQKLKTKTKNKNKQNNP